MFSESVRRLGLCSGLLVCSRCIAARQMPVAACNCTAAGRQQAPISLASELVITGTVCLSRIHLAEQISQLRTHCSGEWHLAVIRARGAKVQ